MRKLIVLNICTMAVLLGSCSSDSKEPDNPEPVTKDVNVEIITDILTKATVTNQYTEGDQMNVVAKAYNKPNADAFCTPSKATMKGGRWNLQPSITLQEGEHTFIYALSPYQESLPEDLSEIPIDISRQLDILYSGNSVPVSHTTYTAKLTMKHALALVSFNIKSQGYSGKGELQKLSVDGNVIFSQATLNIENGKLKGTRQGPLSVSVNKAILTGGWPDELPRIWVMPFVTKSETATLEATIDGKKRSIRFPEIEMRGGYQYIFHLILTDYGITFIPDQTETISLNQEQDEMKALEGYGLIRIGHQASEFTLPTLLGDNVFGSVTWGVQSGDNYAFGLTHTYGTDARKEVVIESWNTTGFEMNQIEGITSIDISGYE